jgi:Rrf2 family nitric oxide-sensitive transcriptional repressor
MRLTDYTDYTLRVLMFCAFHPERCVTIAELAESHAVSKNNLMKIVNDLARQGLLLTTRGRGGGLRLGKAASDIGIGDVVRQSETDFRLVECFDAARNTCNLAGKCQLKRVIQTARDCFLAELDKVTLADITRLPPTPKAATSAVKVGAIQRAASKSTPLPAAATPTDTKAVVASRPRKRAKS